MARNTLDIDPVTKAGLSSIRKGTSGTMPLLNPRDLSESDAGSAADPRPNTAQELELETSLDEDDAPTLEIDFDSLLDVDTDAVGTDERGSVENEPIADSPHDIGFDRIISADDAGLGGGLDQAEEARFSRLRTRVRKP
jgi:hypothetical protein